MSDIFISYASVDRDRVAPIARALEARGWRVWWDRKIPAGQSFDRVIEDALTNARCVVVVWSRHSIDSTWVRAEANEGLLKHRLVPIAIDDVQPPLVFRQIQTADLSHWTKDPSEEAFKRFVADLSELLGGGTAGIGKASERKVTNQGNRVDQRRSIGWLRWLSIAGLLVAAVAALGYWAWAGRSDVPEFLVAEIPRGTAPALRWKTRNADEVTIDGTPAELEGITSADPSAPHTFVLIAKNRHGRIARKLVWSGSARPSVVVRDTPRMLTGEQVRRLYQTRGFHDSRWNPAGGFDNIFEPLKLGDDSVVIDHATGLMWHQAGSVSEMADWDDASTYLKRLNERQYAGFVSWRLPTLEELATIIEPTATNGTLHIDPIFDGRQRWLWSGDNAGDRYGNQAWGVDLALAHANIHFHGRDVARFGWVRPVRSDRE